MAENEFPGQYYDGRSARNQAVTVSPAPHGVAFRLEDGTQYWWPFDRIKVQRAEGSITFEHGEPLPQALIMNHPEFIAALDRANPRITRGQTSNDNVWWTLGVIAVVAVLIIVVVVRWGFPMLTAAMAAAMPLSVEKRIGEAVVNSMISPGKRCEDPSLDRIAAVLARRVSDNPYEFHIYVAEDPSINAFAAPGGYIVVNRGLLNKTRRPEQAAAVLAHEMQHVLKRHSVKGMMRGLSIWVGLALLTGGGGDTIISLVGTLGGLHYQRSDESQADTSGLRMMEAANIDPKAMVSMLEVLDRVSGDAPEPMKYLSSHPLNKERIEQIRALAGEYRGAVSPLLPGEPWPPEAKQCRVAPTATTSPLH